MSEGGGKNNQQITTNYLMLHPVIELLYSPAIFSQPPLRLYECGYRAVLYWSGSLVEWQCCHIVEDAFNQDCLNPQKNWGSEDINLSLWIWPSCIIWLYILPVFSNSKMKSLVSPKSDRWHHLQFYTIFQKKKPSKKYDMTSVYLQHEF